jgi:hypothetical protein
VGRGEGPFVEFLFISRADYSNFAGCGVCAIFFFLPLLK